MKKRLNITIREDLNEKIKKYADHQKNSISNIVEEHFEELLHPSSKLPQKISLVEYVKKLPKVELPEDFDYKEAFHKAKANRHGTEDFL